MDELFFYTNIKIEGKEGINMNNLDIIKRKAVQIFSEEDLDEAIIEYQKRTRKFGAN